MDWTGQEFTSSLTLDISTKNTAYRYSKFPRSRLCLVSVPTCRCFAIVSIESACCVWYLRCVYVCKIFEDKGKKQYSLSLFQTQSRGLSWLVRCDLHTHLSIFCDCSALKVLVAFGIYGVCKVFEDKAKKQCPLLIFQTPGAVSCLVRQDLRTYLPIFCDCKCLLHWCLTVYTYTRSSRTKRRNNTLYRYSKLPASRAWWDVISVHTCQCFARREQLTFRTGLLPRKMASMDESLDCTGTGYISAKNSRRARANVPQQHCATPLIFNPFTAMLAAPSLWKTTNKSAKSEIIQSFFPTTYEHVRGFLLKFTALKIQLL